MNLTKYEHACIVLEEQGKKLVIDPGGFTEGFGALDNIVAVVITHTHSDHFNPSHIAAIITANPDVQIFTTEEVAPDLSSSKTTTVRDGLEATAGPFTLRFYGELHQPIHSSLPRLHNTGVLVNGQFYYPGDSFTQPDTPVAVLAVPGNAPWATIGETIDYILAVKPKRCFPTHNGLLSEHGHMVYNGGIRHGCEQAGSQFQFLQPGESLDI